MSKQVIPSSTHLLYQDELLKHHQQPTGFELAFNADHEAFASNAFCGDEITIKVKLSVDKIHIEALAFFDDSCAICRASASILCHHLLGKTLAEAHQLATQTQTDLTGETVLTGALSPLNGVRQYPVRLQCAVLPWTTFSAALRTEGY